ncbi:MAG: glycosyltransferase [Streptosporangiales bacterium]
MRVLIVHNRYRSAAPSGENRVVDQESAALTAAGHDVEHFEQHSDDIELWSPARKAALPAQVVWNRAARHALSGVLRRFRPDVVHVHNTFPLLSPSVLYACRDAEVPIVATIHNYKLMCASGDFFRAGKVCHDCASGLPVSALAHRCYRGSALATLPVVAGAVAHRRAWRSLVSAYIFISASQRQLLSGLHLDPARMFVKANLVPCAASPRTARQRRVAYVGRLDAAKGVPLLLEAWDRYRATAGDDALRLTIAGSGPLAEHVSQWAESRPSVELAGLLDKRQCFDLLAGSRAVLLPSQWEETFGLVVVEGMAVGTPAVAAAHGSFPELVADGVDGALFRPGDPADLARVLHDVDAYPHRFGAYGQRARSTYEQRFEPAQNISQLVDIYQFATRYPASAEAPRAEPVVG